MANYNLPRLGFVLYILSRSLGAFICTLYFSGNAYVILLGGEWVGRERKGEGTEKGGGGGGGGGMGGCG